MNENPWEVESIMAFYFLKCPECEFDTQKETDFEEHAKENHPLSNSFFGKKRTRYEFDLFVPDVSLEEEGDENNEVEEIEPETEVNEENDEYSDIEEVPTAENSFNRKRVKNKDVSPWTAGPSASISDDRGPSVSISVVKNSKSLPLPPGIHGGGKGLYKCNMCDSRFFSDGELKTHIITVHEAEKKYYACSVCEASFARNGDLKRHIQSVHEKKKPHQCAICGGRFGEKRDMKRHILSVHEKVKEFKCPTCDRGFAQQGSLRIHIDTVHEKLKPFVCDLCGKNFGRKVHLNKHVKSVHKDNPLLAYMPPIFQERGRALNAEEIRTLHPEQAFDHEQNPEEIRTLHPEQAFDREQNPDEIRTLQPEQVFDREQSLSIQERID